MAQTPPSPELVEAYKLIKAGQRIEAGRILKGYLAQHKEDANAWWLMANAASQPDTIRRCLETVLKLDPNHAKARAKLDKLAAESGAAPVEAAAVPAPISAPQTAPAAAPLAAPIPAPSRALPGAKTPSASSVVAADDFPDDAMILGHFAAVAVAAAPAVIPQAAPLPAPKATPAAPSRSFEDFLTAAPGRDPHAGPPIDDPFAGITDGSATSTEELFAYTPPAPDDGSVPFTATFNPDDAITGAPIAEADLPVESAKPQMDRILKMAGIVLIVFVIAMALLWILDSSGALDIGGEQVPAMTSMDAGSFTVEYPKNWDMRCLTDISGYPVCGIANHRFYNEVDYFAGTDIDFGAMIADSFSMAFSGENLPEEQVSIIVMDVPRTSPSYYDKGWAKTNYEMVQQGWFFDTGAKVKYSTRKERTIDGRKAYYYEFTSEGSTKHAAWDVYIEHDGIILWLRVDYFGPRDKRIPHKTVQAMIESIDIRPVEEW
jgi:hypothetical protein